MDDVLQDDGLAGSDIDRSLYVAVCQRCKRSGHNLYMEEVANLISVGTARRFAAQQGICHRGDHPARMFIRPIQEEDTSPGAAQAKLLTEGFQQLLHRFFADS